METSIKQKDISQINIEHTFFHYTNVENLESIFLTGLEPRIGKNSLYVEKTAKIFFVQGEKGILTIIDVWLRWLTAKTHINRFIYRFGTFYMKIPFCIKKIPNSIVEKNLDSKKNRYKMYKHMKEILDNSVFLILELEENIDFDYDDIDEVKCTYYESFLKLLYPKNSDLKDKKMEYWNMHTRTDRKIDSSKITLLKSKNQISASFILKECIEKNKKYVEENCDFLNEYYAYNFE